MESLRCPVCCGNKFSSKQALIDHLTEVYQNLSCTVCSKKYSTMPQLMDHLNFDNCQRISDVFEVETEATTQDYPENYSPETKTETIDISDNQVLGCDKMFVELFSDQMLKTQELKLVTQDGENRYIIVDGASQDLNQANSFVTKQNNDGTISLTSNDTLLSDHKLDVLEDGMENEEIYSCNTCGVSFTSVIDHIQMYHNDQDVVLETPMDEGINNNDLPEEDIPVDTNDKSVLRRMITETGNIIETPSVLKINMALQKTLATNFNMPNDLRDGNLSKDFGRSISQKALVNSSLQKESQTSSLLKDPLDCNQSKSPGYNHLRHVHIDKFCVSTVKNINENENEQNGPFHKVVLKEIRTKTDGKIRLYHCLSCLVYVKNLDDFKMQPCKKLKYSCPHCSVAYDNSKSLCAHMKVHKIPIVPTEDLKPIVSSEASTPLTEAVETTEKSRFPCTICSTIFTSNKSLKLHKRMHDPIKIRPIATPVVEGEEQEEDEKLKFLCDVCNKWIPEDYREIHLKSHDATENINCDICNKKFISIKYLEMHMKVHNLEKVKVVKQDESLPYSCIYCNRRFSRPHEKVKHERIHTGEKPHSCEICGKSFRVSYCLTLHMRTHTGARPYACLHCGKRFKAHSVYNHHLLTHSDVRAYKCPFCPKAFKTSVQLAGHKNCHTKPFSCQQCNRPFSSLYAVRVHTETHARANNLKFCCTQCGASYARAFALKDHISQVHENAAVMKINLKNDTSVSIASGGI